MSSLFMRRFITASKDLEASDSALALLVPLIGQVETWRQKKVEKLKTKKNKKKIKKNKKKASDVQRFQSLRYSRPFGASTTQYGGGANWKRDDIWSWLSTGIRILGNIFSARAACVDAECFTHLPSVDIQRAFPQGGLQTVDALSFIVSSDAGLCPAL